MKNWKRNAVVAAVLRLPVRIWGLSLITLPKYA